jgi:mannitol 2-dehydrogenase
MVDRITPKATKIDQDIVFEKTGIIDQCPVVCEPFRQWIIEDNFVSERPKWELAGVQFVSDVAPYEKMKLRLLNGSHQALCYLGYLHGYRFVHEASSDPDFQCFLNNYMTNEVQPTLDKVKGIDLGIYQRTLIERFSNPNISDTLQRICEFTSDRIPIFNLPVIFENKEKQPDLKYASLILASWLVYLEGKDENGIEIPIVDHKKEMLLRLAKKAQANPQLFLDEKSIFLNLSENKQFIKLFERSYYLIKANGAKGAIKALMFDK